MPEFWRSPASAPMFELAVSNRAVDPVVAVAIAEGSVDGAPDNNYLRSRLAQTYRETSRENVLAAWETCREFFTKYPEKLMIPPIRPLVLEWAVTAGECTDKADHGAQNLWLALLSFSDQCGGQEIAPKHVRHLPTITKGLQLTGDLLSGDLAGRVAKAILLVGRMVPGTHYLREVESIAKQAKSEVSLRDLSSILSELSREAWALTANDFRSYPYFPRQGLLTFRLLANATKRLA